MKTSKLLIKEDKEPIKNQSASPKRKKKRLKIGLLFAVMFIGFLFAFVANLFLETRFVNEDKVFYDAALYKIRSIDTSEDTGIDLIPLYDNHWLTFSFPNDQDIILNNIYVLPLSHIGDEQIYARLPQLEESVRALR